MTGSPTGSAAALLVGAADAGRRERARMAALTREIFLPDEARVDEARRSRIRDALDDLVATVEVDLRRQLAERLDHLETPALRASLESLSLPMARARPEDAATLADDDLIALLSRRVDEHRLVVQARIAATRDPQATAAGLFEQLLLMDTEGIATAAANVRTAELRGFGRFEEPVLAPADLPADTYHRLVWRIAAAVRRWFVGAGVIAMADADRAIAAAAGKLIIGHDETQGLDTNATLLARAMLRSGIADDAAIVALATEGHVAVAVASIALRAGIPLPSAWDMVRDRQGGQLVLLLRASGVARAAVAALLLRWPDATTQLDVIADAIACYDELSIQAAADAIDLYRLDSAYARAIVDLTIGQAAA